MFNTLIVAMLFCGLLLAALISIVAGLLWLSRHIFRFFLNVYQGF